MSYQKNLVRLLEMEMPHNTVPGIPKTERKTPLSPQEAKERIEAIRKNLENKKRK